jgi:hypothetical protein
MASKRPMASQNKPGATAPAVRRLLLFLLVGAAILACGAMIWRANRAAANHAQSTSIDQR